MITRFLLITVILPLCLAAQQSDSLLLKKASNYPMQYFISLPAAWSKDKQWPVVVIIESADKEYRENALRFVRARQQMPFILVAPYNVNNSRFGRRDPKIFPYDAATWDFIEKEGDCRFNMEGIKNIVTDVHTRYNGESRFFITGFEAGAHTVWQFVFQRPDLLRAAATVAANFNQNSCMNDDLSFSKDQGRLTLPVMEFTGAMDTLYGQKSNNYNQWLHALKAGTDHGFGNMKETVVQEKGHIPMPREILDWFYKLYQQ